MGQTKNSLGNLPGAARPIGVWLALLLALGVRGAVAGDGVVALQTADPSCPDDSGNIYVDCGNGTVTDNRTGLVWLQNADCFNGQVDWYAAMEFVAGLSDIPDGSAAAGQDCGLSDGSLAGEWRLPSVAEWEAMAGVRRRGRESPRGTTSRRRRGAAAGR